MKKNQIKRGLKKNRKPPGIIIGYAYVCADLMHVGHINHLESCKKFCDKLIVGVLTDKAVMEKKTRPIFSFEERLRLVQALECVDIAVCQDTYTPLNNASIMADILFESTSHTKEAIEEAKIAMEKLNKKVIVLPYYVGQSSTAIKTKIKKEWRGNDEKSNK